MDHRRQILDDEWTKPERWQLQRDEKVLWSDQPRPPSFPTLLQLWGFQEALTGPLFPLAIVQVYLIVRVLSASARENWLHMAGLLVLLILVVIMPEILKTILRRTITYAITNQRVIFDLGGKRRYSLSHADIHQVRYEAYRNGNGILHFFPRHQAGFTTRDLFAFKKRLNPTFENIEQVETVAALLTSLLP